MWGLLLGILLFLLLFISISFTGGSVNPARGFISNLFVNFDTEQGDQALSGEKGQKIPHITYSEPG